MIRPLQIGSVTLPNNLILAPMAGVTDLPFRLLCKEQGAGLLCMEMVSAKAILYKNRNTQALLTIDPRENPVSLQLFGSDPDIIAEIAHQIEDRPFDILDLNMGCPVPKIVNNGEGSALMKNPKLAGEIIEKTVKAIKKPVTVKNAKGLMTSMSMRWRWQRLRKLPVRQQLPCMDDQGAVLFRQGRLGHYPSGKRSRKDSGHRKRRSAYGGGCDCHGRTDRM